MKQASRRRPSGASGARTSDALHAFLERLLPRLGLRPKSYRKKRRTVRRRLHRRMNELALPGYDDYLEYVEEHPDEAKHLRHVFAITVGRFFRNREDWFHLARSAFPALAELARAEAERAGGAGGVPSAVRAASLGCGGGEEPYTLAIAWKELGAPGVDIDVLALDLEDACLERGRRGVYPASSFRSMPGEFLRHLERLPGDPERFRVSPELRRSVRFSPFDYVAEQWPSGLHLLLVRHSAFFYLDEAGSRDSLRKARESLVPGGRLFLGSNEGIPGGDAVWVREGRNLYRRQLD